MAIQYPNFPLLTGAQMGVPDAIGAMAQGNSYVDQMIQTKLHKLEAEKNEKLMPFVEPNAQAELKTKQQHNEWDPKIWSSEIGARGAQAALQNKETQWYDEKAKSDIAYKAALAKQQEAEAAKSQFLMDELKKSGVSGNTPESAIVPGNSSYGIEIPKPSHSDLLSKVEGFDTFTPRMNKALEQIKNEQTEFSKISQNNNNAYLAAKNYLTELDKFNVLTDKTAFSGALMGKAPGWMDENAQAADTISQQMGKTGVEQLRQAMGSARFSNLDMNLAQGLKPSRTWSKTAKELHTAFAEAATDRLGEQNQFFDVIRNHPELGINKDNANALWRSYQDAYPISNGKDKVKSDNVNSNKWQEFLSPDAVNAIKKTGKYDPNAQTNARKAKESGQKNTGNKPVIKVTMDANGNFVRES